jgi:hypothetical protein
MPGRATCNFKALLRLARIFTKELVWLREQLTAAQRAAFAADTPVGPALYAGPGNM